MTAGFVEEEDLEAWMVLPAWSLEEGRELAARICFSRRASVGETLAHFSFERDAPLPKPVKPIWASGGGGFKSSKAERHKEQESSPLGFLTECKNLHST
jgi:hypothetical protein